MLSGSDMFYDDPFAPPPPQLYNPPLPVSGPGWGWDYGPIYYPGWNNSAPPPPPPAQNKPPQHNNNNRPPQHNNPPAQNRPPQQQPSQPVKPSQPTTNGQRPGANINFGSGGSNGNNQTVRPSGGAGGRH